MILPYRPLSSGDGDDGDSGSDSDDDVGGDDAADAAILH